MGTFPNKSTQFSSINQPVIPGGVNKKGSKHLSTWIKELLNDEEFTAYIPDVRAGYVEFKGAPAGAIIKAMAIRALSGDTKAFEVLAKYGYGQKLEVEHSGEVNVAKQLTDEELNERIRQYTERHNSD